MRWGWPGDEAGLVALQEELAVADPPPWEPHDDAVVGGSYVCFSRAGRSSAAGDDRAWAAGARKVAGSRTATVVVGGVAPAPYVPGLLALREGALRERALRALPGLPDVLLVDATGRDHPRHAGLALHLGAVLDVASIGVTDRPLVADADEPADRRGAVAPLRHRGVTVGYAVRTRGRARCVYVSAGWRTDAQGAVAVVLRSARRQRTPQPLREARRAARHARDRADGA